MNHDSLIRLITHYGYAGIFVSLFIGIVGLPLPIEIFLLGAGYIAVKTDLHLGGIISFAWLGACAGMTLNYLLWMSLCIFIIRFGLLSRRGLQVLAGLVLR